VGYRRKTLRHDDVVMIGDEAWITVSAAAILLGRSSDSSIRRWIDAGLLPSQKAKNGKIIVPGRQVLKVEARSARATPNL